MILRILYCSLGRYEKHASVKPAMVVGGACGSLCPYWSVLVWQISKYGPKPLGSSRLDSSRLDTFDFVERVEPVERVETSESSESSRAVRTWRTTNKL